MGSKISGHPVYADPYLSGCCLCRDCCIDRLACLLTLCLGFVDAGQMASRECTQVCRSFRFDDATTRNTLRALGQLGPVRQVSVTEFLPEEITELQRFELRYPGSRQRRDFS